MSRQLSELAREIPLVPTPAALCGAGCFPAMAREWFVSPEGDNALGDGSRAQPFRTVGHVLDTSIDLTKAGDTIILRKGVYHECDVRLRKRLSLRAETGERISSATCRSRTALWSRSIRKPVAAALPISNSAAACITASSCRRVGIAVRVGGKNRGEQYRAGKPQDPRHRPRRHQDHTEV